MIVSSRARIITWQHHRRMSDKEEWFCLCGEPGTRYPMNQQFYWTKWNEHFVEKATEVQRVLNGTSA